MSDRPVPLHRNRDFALLWGGQLASELGSQITTVAYPLLVLATTGSPAKAGIVGFAKALPMLLLALPGGALADRVDRRRLLIACDAARALALLSLAVAIAAGAGGPAFGHVAVVALVDGSGFALSYVAERGALRNVVAPAQLSEAVARNEARSYAAQLAGPPLGGLLFGLGRALPFLVDAISYAASTTAMLLIRGRLQETRTASRQPLRAELSEGVRWLWRRPFFRTTSLLAAGVNPLFAGLYLLIVVRAEAGGASPAQIGMMLALVGALGLLGGLLAPHVQRRLPTRRALLSVEWLTAATIPAILLTDEPLLLGLVAGAAEMFSPLTNAIVQGLRIRTAPDHLQGRVQAAAMLLAQSFGWLGPLAVGIAVQALGATATVVALAGWMLTLAAAATWSRGLSESEIRAAQDGTG